MEALHGIEECVQVLSVPVVDAVVDVITIVLVNGGQLKVYFSFRCYLCC